MVGPHFEETCRQWARWHTDPGTYGNRYPGRVASGTVSDGEAKWQETVTTSHLKKLEHIRGLLQARGEPGAESARLLLFSGTGFSDAVMKRAESDPTIQLVGLDRLYYGS